MIILKKPIKKLLENEIFPNIDNVINAEDIKDDNIISEMVKQYLNCMTIFAVGVNTGIYDINVLDRIAN